ncbi:MAG TPA: hypothetical protein VD840_15900 [Sinorhizobium sp.]|nr:hypothetical protein [Sinorhizobium sp.]
MTAAWWRATGGSSRNIPGGGTQARYPRHSGSVDNDLAKDRIAVQFLHLFAALRMQIES